MNEILEAFKVLDKAPKAEPSFQPLDIKDILRDDTDEEPLTQKKSLSNTKHKEKGFFKGPRVV